MFEIGDLPATCVCASPCFDALISTLMLLALP